MERTLSSTRLNTLSNNDLRRRAALWLASAMKTSIGPKRGAWTAVALAAKSGVSRGTIWRIQTEQTDPEAHTIQALAAALGVAMPDLRGYRGGPEPGAVGGASGRSGGVGGTRTGPRQPNGSLTTPPYDGAALTELCTLVAEQIGKAVAEAVEQAVQKNELGSSEGLKFLADVLEDMAEQFRRRDYDFGEILRLANFVRRIREPD